MTGQALQASTGHYRSSGSRRMDDDDDDEGLDVGIDDLHHQQTMQHSPGGRMDDFFFSFHRDNHWESIL